MKLTLILLSGLLIFASQAFAIRDGDGTPASIRQAQFAIQLVTIQGALSCDMGESNSGAACTLKFKEQKSGQIYTLTGKPELTNAAMRLYHSGSRNVGLQGKIAGASFEIENVQGQN